VGGILRVRVMHHLHCSRSTTVDIPAYCPRGVDRGVERARSHDWQAEWVAVVAAGLTGLANFVILFRATKFSLGNLSRAGQPSLCRPS
jgi:hypothetical protein